MHNDKVIRLIRVLGSTVISVTALIAAAILLDHNIIVPAPWWLIATLAVGGVTGADVIAAALESRRAGGQDGN